ncbi:MAG: hypothetical protein ABFS17_00145 [Chloroflexota bacterium]
MDQETVGQLKQAAGLIKEGKLKSARKILVELLRDHPEVDQAWYMLSFTVPVLDRQIYALEQALKVNPNNDKALTRLLKLQESGGAAHQAAQAPPPKQEQPRPVRPKTRPGGALPTDPSDDLLSKRLLGEDKPAPTQEDKVPPEEVTKIVPEPVAADPEPVEEDLIEKEQAKVEKQEKKKEKYTKKVFGMRRGVFLLIMLIAIFSCFGLAGRVPQIRYLIAGNQPQAEGTPGEGIDGTPEADATSEINLAATWTPTAPATIEPTQEPEPSVPMLSDLLFDFEEIRSPSDEEDSEFDLIREQLGGIMDETTLPQTNGFVVSENDLASVLSEYARLAEYRDLTRQVGFFYTGFGLAAEPAETDSLIQNLWADPNGTILFADSGKVILTDFPTSQYQRYAYAHAVVQNYRNERISFADLGYYPICSPVEESCEILRALIKGEAAYFANKWGVEYFGETATQEYNQTEINRFTVPAVDGAPAFIEETLAFPDSFGTILIEGYYNSFGLESLDSLYVELPASTEQLIHPEKYDNAELPVEVLSSDLADELGVSWQEVFKGTLGEWKTYLMMAAPADTGAEVSDATAANAAAGWGGDAAQLYLRMSTQEYVILVEWEWDTQADADEFRNAFNSMLNSKDGASVLQVADGVTCYQNHTSVDCLFIDAQRVVWTQAPDLALIQSILSAIGIVEE